VECPLREIRTVRESRLTTVNQITAAEVNSRPFVIACTSEPFRACMGTVDETPVGGVRINARVAEALGVLLGDKVIISPLRPRSVD
jgi:arginine/ornithine N-succinyltransferase beta subunit